MIKKLPEKGSFCFAVFCLRRLKTFFEKKVLRIPKNFKFKHNDSLILLLHQLIFFLAHGRYQRFLFQLFKGTFFQP